MGKQASSISDTQPGKMMSGSLSPCPDNRTETRWKPEEARERLHLSDETKPGAPGSGAAFDPGVFPPNMDSYLRVLMRKQPLLRVDWETFDFFQELSVRFITRLARHGLQQMPQDHRTAIIRQMAWQLGKDKLRQIQRAKRDCRRRKNHAMDHFPAEGDKTDPLEQICERETVTRIRETLPSADWSLLEMRSSGMAWEEIAQACGGTASSQRMRHRRLVSKLAAQHG